MGGVQKRKRSNHYHYWRPDTSANFVWLMVIFYSRRREILKIVPHEPRQNTLLLKILERASKDPHPIEYHALQLKRLIGIRHPDFLEFVVAVLYRLALVDLIVSKEEETDIRKVAHVFGIKKPLLIKYWVFLTEN